jgi:hypothetical protein
MGTGYSEGHPPPGMGGTGPSAGPPALKRSSSPEVGLGLGELAAGEGEDVVVVVGAGEGEEGVVMGTGVVVSCALTVGGAPHSARSANPAAKSASTTIDNFSTARVRSVISPPAP